MFQYLVFLLLLDFVWSKEPKHGNLTCKSIPGSHGKILCDSFGQEVEYENKADEVISPSNPIWGLYFGVVCFVTSLSGLMSGLTLGLMGMDEINLKIMTKLGFYF